MGAGLGVRKLGRDPSNLLEMHRRTPVMMRCVIEQLKFSVAETCPAFTHGLVKVCHMGGDCNRTTEEAGKL